MKTGESIPPGEPPNPPARKSTPSRHRILVVNDDSDARQLSVQVLTGSGYDVEAAKDGADGWEALQTSWYDLVVTDNKMPRMTGLEMIEELRLAGLSVRVLMATGYLPAHEFARKPWLKPDGELEQPYSNDDLLAAVKKILSPAETEAGSQAMLPLE